MRAFTSTIISSSGLNMRGFNASSAIRLQYLTGYSVQNNILRATSTTNPNGVLSLQCSNDGVSFIEIPGSSAQISTSAVVFQNVLNTSVNYSFMRVLFVGGGTSSSGNLTSIITAKGWG